MADAASVGATITAMGFTNAAALRAIDHVGCDADHAIDWIMVNGGMSALHGAARNGHAGAVRLLAARGGRAAGDARGYDKETPLHLAASEGHIAAVQALLEAGAHGGHLAQTERRQDHAGCRSALPQAQCRGVHTAGRQGPDVAAVWRATSLLASVQVSAGLGELPYDVLRCVCEMSAVLGLRACSRRR